ncbi:MAG: carbamoyltransferase HypF [Rhodomicrobium sp.]
MESAVAGISIRVRGLVQGVGFRPTVWRLANSLGLAGEVLNDGEGVLIHAWGPVPALLEFELALSAEAPPLSRVDSVESAPLEAAFSGAGFHIVQSKRGPVRTGIVADAATCAACLADIRAPSNRRYRYPFTNCTHCGPRLSIVHAIPYDRATTSMAKFPMCPACLAEYSDPADRRFHAQPNACPDCGPKVWLESATGAMQDTSAYRDAVEAAAALIATGEIVAIKGIGGFHLACDACNADAVARLRLRKARYGKPFALMARDLEMIADYAELSQAERTLLSGVAAPIVILRAKPSQSKSDGVMNRGNSPHPVPLPMREGTLLRAPGIIQGSLLPGGEGQNEGSEVDSLPDRAAPLAPGVAPEQSTLGFMLPYTPLHHLLMENLARPIVLTSGNRSDEPQCVDNTEARERLSAIADFFLMHDRDIVNRLDDSVVRVMAGKPRLLRRARGHAPTPLPLPAGFEGTPPVLAMGAELKSTFCLLKDGQAIVSQHMGDLEEAATHTDYRRNLELYRNLFRFEPETIAVDAHPDYISTKWGLVLAEEGGLPAISVQHHHAHIAAALGECGIPLSAPPVIGIALDGLGLSEDGELWGGEFLLADYRSYRRLAHFVPLPLIGGAKAMREPWRNTLAHLHSFIGWEAVRARYPDLEAVRLLQGKPVETCLRMMERGINSPAASSAGRLFDAVAAALGLCFDAASYEGQAAIELEALAEGAMADAGAGYGCTLRSCDPAQLGWAPLWEGILRDLATGTDRAMIAARFHRGLIETVCSTAYTLAKAQRCETAVLTGGVFQNRILLEGVSEGLTRLGVKIVAPAAFPANDGGVSLGQALIATARQTVATRRMS